MEIRIESPHFKLAEQLNEYVNDKVIKLEHLNERLIRSEVCLKLDKSATTDNKICEIRVLSPGKDLFACKRNTTFEDAIAKTVHALEKQLRKKKTKQEKEKAKLTIEEVEEGEE
jgi:putative sigma-54 modulation protein